MYCRHCGQKLAEGALYCSGCAAPVQQKAPGKKQWLTAGLLAMFLGVFGVHNFYLGDRSKAMTQLLVATVGGILSCGVSTLVVGGWAVIEAIQLFSGKRSTDANGNLLI